MGQDLFHAGLESFNARDFFAAHEHWEDWWRGTTGETRNFVQGLVPAAVGRHHYSTGNVRGARSVLARGLRNMRSAPAPATGTDLQGLRDLLEQWLAALNAGAPLPPIPRLEPLPPDGKIAH